LIETHDVIDLLRRSENDRNSLSEPEHTVLLSNLRALHHIDVHMRAAAGNLDTIKHLPSVPKIMSKKPPLVFDRRQDTVVYKYVSLYKASQRQRTVNPLSRGHSTDSAGRRLHPVIGHYCYRRRADGSEARICWKDPYRTHRWQPVEGRPLQETCSCCGQLRWFRPTHERGNESIGRVVRVYR
jgi:hypothetical protein